MQISSIQNVNYSRQTFNVIEFMKESHQNPVKNNLDLISFKSGKEITQAKNL